MYDRYAIFSSAEEIKNQFDVAVEEEITPNYNAAPTQLLPVITAEDSQNLQWCCWGIPSEMAHNKALSPKLFNLPVSSALGRPLYRKQLETHRCIILCNGFYIWKPIGKKKKTPYFCYLEQYQLFALAGVWENYEDLDGHKQKTFNMITSPSEGLLSEYQDDLPVILTSDNVNTWLSNNASKEKLEEIMSSSKIDDLSLHAVNPAVGDPKNNNKDLIKASPPADQFGNYTLFS